MKVKTQDVVVEKPFPPGKPDSDMVACGWTFLCSHITVDRFIEDDFEIEVPSWPCRISAVEHAGGVNFYAKAL